MIHSHIKKRRLNKNIDLSDISFSKYSAVENFNSAKTHSMKTPQLAGSGAGASRPALPDPAWLARTNCHMFQLVWLWMMIYFHYFWQSLSYSFGQ